MYLIKVGISYYEEKIAANPEQAWLSDSFESPADISTNGSNLRQTAPSDTRTERALRGPSAVMRQSDKGLGKQILSNDSDQLAGEWDVAGHFS